MMKYYTAARRILPAPLRKALLSRYRKQPEFVREAMLNLFNEFKIAKINRESNRAFESLKGAQGLKVHLGCGPLIKPGWINIDLTDEMPQPAELTSPDTVFINYDLRLGLPLDDASAEIIYSAHFFEHLKYAHGLRLLRDCFRVLAPGGTFRISLPDFKTTFGAYVQANEKHFELIDIHEVIPEIEPGTETLVDQINYGVYQNGEHKCIYDEEKIITLLRKLGYRSVAQSSYQAGVDPEDPVRRKHSFYVEAIK